jgi:hypothetical protein
MATATRFQTNLLDVTFNGWTNYKTWNVALYINNKLLTNSVVKLVLLHNSAPVVS